MPRKLINLSNNYREASTSSAFFAQRKLHKGTFDKSALVHKKHLTVINFFCIKNTHYSDKSLDGSSVEYSSHTVLLSLIFASVESLSGKTNCIINPPSMTTIKTTLNNTVILLEINGLSSFLPILSIKRNIIRIKCKHTKPINAEMQSNL